MSILTQHKYSVSPGHLFGCQRHHHDHVPARISCAITTPNKPKFKDLVVEPSLNPPPLTPATSFTGPNPNNPTVQSTWSHRVWLACGCTTVLLALAKSILTAFGSHIWVKPVLAGLIAYLLADLVSGFYHWGIDNYGDASTPICGTQIKAFQRHHKWPWIVTRATLANTLHIPARAVTMIVLPVDLMVHDPKLNAFIGVLSRCIVMSEQIHAWAHNTKSKLPRTVVTLQDMGVLLSRSQHEAHHRPPYNRSYCIISGIWNKVLDETKVFVMLEMVLFLWVGVRPRSWTGLNLECTQEITSQSSK